MSHLSPYIFLLWSILATILGIFYFSHLWKFDRFRCLNLMRDRQGAFKRFMTYSYLTAVPLLLVYTIGHAVIKYKEGFITLPNGSVSPKPFELWSPEHQTAYFPLNMAWALSWAAEAVSHIEELCFWFFLIHAGASPTPWFKSTYFKIWMGGSISAVTLIIVATTITKTDPLMNEAWLLLSGSSISLLITIGFLPILWRFPKFIRTVQREGADMAAVVRLVKFHDLNIIRIVFRFLFVAPIWVLAVNAVHPHTHDINEITFWTDLLYMVSGVACVIQSSITLMIFFPRNLEFETKRWLCQDELETPLRRMALPKLLKKSSKDSSSESQSPTHHPKYLLTDSPVVAKADLPTQLPDYRHLQQPTLNYNDPIRLHSTWSDEYVVNPFDQQDGQQAYGVSGSSLSLAEANLPVLSKENRPQVNPLALYFTSPIDLRDGLRRPQ